MHLRSGCISDFVKELAVCEDLVPEFFLIHKCVRITAPVPEHVIQCLVFCSGRNAHGLYI